MLGGGDGSAAGKGCQLPIQLPMHPHILAFARMLTSELQREQSKRCGGGGASGRLIWS